MLFKDAVSPGMLELLIKLQSEELLKGFYLAGGTSLSLQIGHRISVDLDLFSTDDFAVEEMLEFLESNYNFASFYTSKNTIRGSIDEIKIDIISHKYPLVEPPVFKEGVALISIKDISAMKLNAIALDGTRSKDFVDLYFLLKQFSIEEILGFYQKKYKTRNILHVLKSLTYFSEVKLSDWPVMLKEKQLRLGLISRDIETKVNRHIQSMK